MRVIAHTPFVAEPRYVLTVFVRGVVQEHALPARGRVVIGRDTTADIAIADASVSRHHAALDVDVAKMPPIAITDLGSANGVRIATASLATNTGAAKDGSLTPNEPKGVTLDDCLYIGNVMCTLRREVQAPTGMDAVRELAKKAARSDIAVLLLGETGVGKEVLAESIHAASPRANGPLVRLHCAALSESLLESELFGHVKGAFTGALRDRAGLIESAAGGTLFLDEIGEMPMATQVKLLRVLEDQKVLPVGANAPKKVDFRLVAATNRELDKEAARGTFRQDLFFRISGFVLRIPPLRERKNEIAPITEAMLSDIAVRTSRTVPVLSGAALEALHRHTWPGNLRELKRVLERALVLATDRIEPEHLLIDGDVVSSEGVTSGAALKDDLESYERARIEQALAEHDGNQTRAAKALGMPRRTLVAKIAKWGLRAKD